MRTIPVRAITDNQFLRARQLGLPVTILDALTYRCPSATRGERVHTVRFDSFVCPRRVSCTCEAFDRSQPCWAMARALDVNLLFAIAGIRFDAAEEPAGDEPAARTAEQSDKAHPPLTASIGEDGALEMLVTSRPGAGGAGGAAMEAP